MQMSGSIPSKGAQLRQLKKGAKTELHQKANLNEELQKDRIPLHRASYAQYTAALLEGERLLTELTDDDKANNPIVPPEQKDKDKEKDKDKNKGKASHGDVCAAVLEAKKASQDPALTTALKDNTICVNYVCHTLAKGRPCRAGKDCDWLHVLPDTVGLKNENYTDFVVNSAHLKSPDANTKINWGVPNGGGLLPLVNGGALVPSVGMPTTTSPDQEQDPQPQNLR